MKIYYSGASLPNQPQAIPDQSLGGFLSSTIVPQGVSSNIFDPLSSYALQKGKVDVRGLFLINDDTVTVNNLSLYIVYPADLVGIIKVEFAAVTANNNNQIENISSGNSSPYYATFVENTDPANPTILINSLAAGGVIGFWLRRTINASPAPSCDTLYAAYSEIIPPADLSSVNIPPAPVAPSNEIPNVIKEQVLLNFAWS